MDQDVRASVLEDRPNDSRGFIHKRIGGAVGGFLTGGVTGAIGGFARGGRATRPTTGAQFQIPGGGSQVRTFQVGPFGLFGKGTSVSRFSIPQGTGTAVGELIGVGLDRAARGSVLPTADGCPKGFHLNKSSYTLKSGQHIPERTLCVRNRRRNNDNGKAALRAARRLIGRKKGQEVIDKALRAIAPPSRRKSTSKASGTPQIIVAGN